MIINLTMCHLIHLLALFPFDVDGFAHSKSQIDLDVKEMLESHGNDAVLVFAVGINTTITVVKLSP